MLVFVFACFGMFSDVYIPSIVLLVALYRIYLNITSVYLYAYRKRFVLTSVYLYAYRKRFVLTSVYLYASRKRSCSWVLMRALQTICSGLANTPKRYGSDIDNNSAFLELRQSIQPQTHQLSLLERISILARIHYWKALGAGRHSPRCLW